MLHRNRIGGRGITNRGTTNESIRNVDAQDETKIWDVLASRGLPERAMIEDCYKDYSPGDAAAILGGGNTLFGFLNRRQPQTRLSRQCIRATRWRRYTASAREIHDVERAFKPESAPPVQQVVGLE